ncbi:MAG: aldehyde dehydrogenase family protein, partial [Acidimicrobiales bacterium]
PFSPATRLGPVISAVQRDRVRGHIGRAQGDGARLVTGGVEPPEGLDRGWFVRPTVLAAVAPASALAQEEVFGPVLAILGHDGDDDAVAIANGTPYGLAAAVWSGDPDRAMAVAGRLRAGQVEVNGGAFNPLAPFGGFKQSGVGRELGRFGLEAFVEVKAIQR